MTLLLEGGGILDPFQFGTLTIFDTVQVGVGSGAQYNLSGTAILSITNKLNMAGGTFNQTGGNCDAFRSKQLCYVSIVQPLIQVPWTELTLSKVGHSPAAKLR